MELKVSPQVVTRLEGLRTQINARDCADVIAQALAVFDTLLSNELSGGKALLIDREDEPLAELRVLKVDVNG